MQPITCNIKSWLTFETTVTSFRWVRQRRSGLCATDTIQIILCEWHMTKFLWYVRLGGWRQGQAHTIVWILYLFACAICQPMRDIIHLNVLLHTFPKPRTDHTLSIMGPKFLTGSKKPFTYFASWTFLFHLPGNTRDGASRASSSHYHVNLACSQVKGESNQTTNFL